MTAESTDLSEDRRHLVVLHDRLEADRAATETALREAQRGRPGAAPGERAEHEAALRTLRARLTRLAEARGGLCFGRTDALDGTRTYIGRTSLLDVDDDATPLLVDWRAPAARPFYTATGARPEGLVHRRHLRTRGAQLVGVTDEDLRTGTGTGDDALLAALDAPRGAGMPDIVATIRAEQDEIIRLDRTGVVVVDGGPGTGKTAVALHRRARRRLPRGRRHADRHRMCATAPAGT